MDYSSADASFGNDLSDSGAPATINMEKLRRIQASIPVQDPNAPLGSNKNPIRIIQQGNRFITTQNLTDEQLSQITQVLHNQSILSEVQRASTVGATSSAAPTPSSRILPSPASKSLFRDLDNTGPGGTPGTAKRRRGKRSPEEDDPDFDPIAEEEGRKPGRYLYPDDSIIFQCDKCDLQFMSRQALFKHVQLRHEQREIRRTQYSPVRKRSALKAALKTSSDEELVDICLPRLAKLANPFDFLLVKSERGDPPLPNLAMLVDDLVNLVDISRKFLRDHLVRLPSGGDQRPPGALSIDTQAKADILGVEVGSYGVRAAFNEGYLPPRHRASLQRRLAGSAVTVTQSQHQEFVSVSTGPRYVSVPGGEGSHADLVGGSGVHTDSAAGSFEISMKIGPKSAQTRQVQQQPPPLQKQQQQQQPVITDKDIAVERYYQVLDENGQPSEFVIEVATGQFFNRITGEQIAVMQEAAEAEVPSGDDGGVKLDKAGGVSDIPESATVVAAPDAAVSKGAAAGDGDKASADNAEAAGVAAATSSTSADGAAAAAAAASGEGDDTGSAEAAAAGASADTGEAVQIDLSAMFPGVTLQDLDDTVLLITKPDGSTLQVEHGGQGITLEFLQELLTTQFD